MTTTAKAVVLVLSVGVAITAAILVAEVLALELWRGLTPMPR